MARWRLGRPYLAAPCLTHAPPRCPALCCLVAQGEYQTRVMQVWKKYNCNPMKSIASLLIQARAALRCAALRTGVRCGLGCSCAC